MALNVFASNAVQLKTPSLGSISAHVTSSAGAARSNAAKAAANTIHKTAPDIADGRAVHV